ncbi:Protein of unknown function [Bacillus cereus]|nr:Protein of unknown function [Bacillus cereus]
MWNAKEIVRTSEELFSG